MKPYVNSTLGFTISYQAPTLDEAIALIGKEEVEKVFLSQMTYRNWNPKFYEAFGDALVEETGVPIPGSGSFTTQKDEYGNEVKVETPVTIKKYLAFLTAGGNLTAERATEIANEVASSPDLATLDISTRTRESKPTKEALELASGVLARVEGGEITSDAWIARYDSINPQRPFATLGEFSLENVARAIKENSDRAARAAKGDIL